MANFSYKARSYNGKIVKGKTKAESKERLERELLNRGLKPIKIIATSIGSGSSGPIPGLEKYIYFDEKGAIQIRLGEDLPTPRELAVFTKQFSLMIENGVPMIQCLELLGGQVKKKSFKDVITAISTLVEQGSSLSGALATFPTFFDNLYIAMIRAGEASGRLDIILKQLVVYIDKSVKVRAQIKKAMAYPLMIAFVAIAVVSGLLAFVVPALAEQFEQNNQELPEITQIVMNLSDFLVVNYLEIFGGLALLIFFFKRWKDTVAGRYIFDTYILKAPIIGDVVQKIAVGRFCSTMSTMLSSGVSILEALSICATSSGNKKVEEFVNSVKDDISKGKSFAEPLKGSTLFPNMVGSMVAVGESTGTLDETLSKITEIYDEEVENAIDTMTSMIEPLMIVFISVIVGFIVIAMYMPVFDMAGAVG
ncbi:MAG: pilus assembly protein PilC [Zetaproteobacteria bacterium]|mgnify:CR=1 FL=1|nr:pilus assembly protein PilC [Pseudobdellovibrionaceae bacterium]